MPKHPPAQEKAIRQANKMLSFARLGVLYYRPVRPSGPDPSSGVRPSRSIEMLYTYIVLQIALLLIALGGYFQVSQFLRQHSAIMNTANMDSFKSMVKVNMYVTLGYLVLGIPGILLSLYISFYEGLTGVFAVLLMNTPIFLLGKHTKKLEMRSRALQCLPAFADEYRTVGETWHKKALPNF